MRPGFEPKSESAPRQATSKPNIILILADDLGYETIGANGGTSYRTPQLDKLAATGVRFTHCYVQPLCTPTRVQFMTGRYNVRNYINFGNMDPQAVTFGNLLKQAGYATCIAGKWQLGHDLDLPKKFGFDEYCLWQHTRRPPRYANPGLEINGVEKDYANGEYGPDLVNDYALDFITRKKDGPFFLYYPMMLTHAPYQPTPDSQDWDPKAQGEQVNAKPEHFGDMVAYMDKLIGKLVARLDALGIRDNTLLLFVGDNGTGRGTRSMMGDKLVIGGKGTTTDAGMHVPLIVNWPGKIAAGSVCSDLVDSTDFLPTLLDAAGVTAPSGLKLDGRTFLPQTPRRRRAAARLDLLLVFAAAVGRHDRPGVCLQSALQALPHRRVLRPPQGSGGETAAHSRIARRRSRRRGEAAPGSVGSVQRCPAPGARPRL